MKRKWLAVGIILLFIGTSIIPSTAQYTVECLPTSNGNWLYVGGNGPGNYTKIQDAIDKAVDGDSIFVYSGIYYENVTIDKTIDLIGENRENTIIDGTGNQIHTNPAVLVNADWVNLSGFTIQKSTMFGMEVRRSNNIHIKNNKIILNYYEGIYIYYSNESTISHNIIRDNGLDGMFCQVLVKCSIYENDIINNDVAGINLGYSSYNEISGNVITGNGYGGIDLFYSNRNNISFNTIISSKLGIGIKNWCFDNTVIFNDIEYHAVGISTTEKSADTSIVFNNIKHNDLGISITENSVGSYIQKNNFINNTYNAYFEIVILKTLLTKIIRSKNVETIRWDRNYWGGNSVPPEIISGKLFLEWVDINEHEQRRFVRELVDYDRHPVKEPYDIPGLS